MSRFSHRAVSIAVFLTLSVATLAGVSTAQTPVTPYQHGGNLMDHFPGISYDPAIPTPESVLGFPLGSRPVRYDEVVRYLKALDDASPRAELHAFGHTHEGRALYYLIVGSQENVRRAQDIKAGMAKVANPSAERTVATSDAIESGNASAYPNAAAVIANSPAIAWMGYSIHGDELSGVDASLYVAYRLVAGTDAESQLIRDSVLTLIDPSQNPDGRERYLSDIYSLAGVAPSTHSDDLQHGGFWPYGRANHYLFDMNRDMVALVHPESQARATTITGWNPQLLVDAHEMWSASSFLMSPAREPINLNVTSTQHRWWDIYAAEQGAEFDKRGWSYYTGDWHEEWFPGYMSSWSLFTGAIGILYEQAGTSGSSVKRPDGTVLPFAEAVAHQAVSSLANLSTTARHRRQLLTDYAKYRADAAAGAVKGLKGAFIIPKGANTSREDRLVTTLMRQGVDVRQSTVAFSASVELAGGKRENRSFAAGSRIVPLAQPQGVLAKALLEFDPHLTQEFLTEERRELEKGNGTQMYEVSSWSLSLAYDLGIAYSPGGVSAASTRLTTLPEPPKGALTGPTDGYGFLVPIEDDRSMNALVRMLEDGLKVRSCNRPFTHDGTSYVRGTLLLRSAENPGDLGSRLNAIAVDEGVDIRGVSSGYSSEGPDLGSDYFQLLERPRIAMMMGAGIDFTSAGFLWYLLDYEMRIRCSLVDIGQIGWTDLDPYNVIIIPSYWGGAEGLRFALSQKLPSLRDWIKAGGTLITVGSSTYFCADSASELSSARERGAVLTQLTEYEKDWQEERNAPTLTVDSNAVWTSRSPKGGEKTSGESKPSDLEALKSADKKGRLFMPRGAILRLDFNPEHWLSFGAGEHSHAIVYSADALMTKSPTEAAARYSQAPDLRVSGLLWPEARERWANTTWCARESMGRGQVIMFADEPYLRAYFHGTKRVFLNSVLLGPGFGANRPSPW